MFYFRNQLEGSEFCKTKYGGLRGTKLRRFYFILFFKKKKKGRQTTKKTTLENMTSQKHGWSWEVEDESWQLLTACGFLDIFKNKLKYLKKKWIEKKAKGGGFPRKRVE